MGLIVRTSDIHAIGVFTTQDIPAGSRIVEYTGPHITEDEAELHLGEREETYLFSLAGGQTIIDGTGVAAFINHSCDPNCETNEADGRVWIIALRDIGAGKELAYDYNLYDGDDADLAPCRCGAPQCRGTMYGEEELARRNVLQHPAKPQLAGIR